MTALAQSAGLSALQVRLADVYAVPTANLLVVRGVWHGLQLALRLARQRNATRFQAPASWEVERLAAIEGLTRIDGGPCGLEFLASPGPEDGRLLRDDDLNRDDARLIVVDETGIETADGGSLAAGAVRRPGRIILRNLSAAFGLSDDPCAAAIACPDTIASLAALIEPEALGAATIARALGAVSPGSLVLAEARVAQMREEKRRLAAALRDCASVTTVELGEAAIVLVTPRQRCELDVAIRRFEVAGRWTRDGRFSLAVGSPDDNDRALFAFGAPGALGARRRSEIRRETNETRIVVAVDLDRAGASSISTGVGFFDHMLAQVASHGGFSLILRCDGDLDVDAHHTIEDCALAFGEALRAALGERRGITRFGFSAPMDEADAEALIDLSGRPHLVFEGAFSSPLLGAYPTEMTEHVFRSISTSLGASIHVRIRGENDHHKTEVAFKAFGRALRAAIRIEGDAIPSTKGVLA